MRNYFDPLKLYKEKLRENLCYWKSQLDTISPEQHQNLYFCILKGLEEPELENIATDLLSSSLQIIEDNMHEHYWVHQLKSKVGLQHPKMLQLIFVHLLISNNNKDQAKALLSNFQPSANPKIKESDFLALARLRLLIANEKHSEAITSLNNLLIQEDKKINKISFYPYLAFAYLNIGDHKSASKWVRIAIKSIKSNKPSGNLLRMYLNAAVIYSQGEMSKSKTFNFLHKAFSIAELINVPNSQLTIIATQVLILVQWGRYDEAKTMFSCFLNDTKSYLNHLDRDTLTTLKRTANHLNIEFPYYLPEF
jgi:tetratricopeptide (TPR) repeat protein